MQTYRDECLHNQNNTYVAVSGHKWTTAPMETMLRENTFLNGDPTKT